MLKTVESLTKLKRYMRVKKDVSIIDPVFSSRAMAKNTAVNYNL